MDLPSVLAEGLPSVLPALADPVLACAPRSPGGWRMLASMIAFVLLAWAFAPSRAFRSRDSSDTPR